ncbi:hypothetical protein ACHAWF_002548 [Thalassiosira exigua]
MPSRELFPVKLYTMLELADARGQRDAGCSWLPHGRAFKIVNRRKFMESDVPTFFNQTRLRSFYRQLNLWGFQRISMGADAGAYYHKFFLRGRPEGLKKIVRLRTKDKSKSDDIDDGKDPDFYSMPPLPIVSRHSSPAGLPGGPTGHAGVPSKECWDQSSPASVPSKDPQYCIGQLDPYTPCHTDTGLSALEVTMSSSSCRPFLRRVSSASLLRPLPRPDPLLTAMNSCQIQSANVALSGLSSTARRASLEAERDQIHRMLRLRGLSDDDLIQKATEVCEATQGMAQGGVQVHREASAVAAAEWDHPIPMSGSSLDAVKNWLAASIEPLPYNQATPIDAALDADEVEGNGATKLEPLPCNGGHHDEFAQLIDGAIHLL